MITKEEFTKLITDYQNYLKRLDEVCQVLATNVWECDWVEYSGLLFDYTIDLLFKPEGVDTICWWLFERKDNQYKMWDANKKEIPMDTLDDLWEYVKTFQR